jgi:curved DNA-binding protein CbpA
MKNYYQILEIPQGTTTVKIKKAYRMLSLKLHPDVNPDPYANDQFIAINEAYQVLKNPYTRNKYDFILNNPSVDSSRASKSKNTVNRSTNKGRRRGTRYAKQSEKRSRRESKWHDRFYFIEIILEVIGSVISGISH